MKNTLIVLCLIFITGVGTCLGIDQSICISGSKISYHPNGHVKSCILKDNFKINGVICKKNAGIVLYETLEMRALKSCTTSNYFEIGDITCNKDRQVSFYQSGTLNTCELFKSIKIDGRNCAQYGSISLFEDGKLKSCSTPH